MATPITLQSVKAGIKIPPQFQEMYTRLVLAGMKVMFSDHTHHLLEKEMNGPGSTDEKLGRGVAGLMILLFKESNKTLPPQIMIPAGTELLMHAVDYFQKTDRMKISDKDIGSAIQIMLGVLMHAFGAKPNEVFAKAQALHDKQPQPLIAGAQGAPAPTAPAIAPAPVAPPAMPAPAAQPMPQGA